MKIEVKVPSPGESITEVQLANWLVDNESIVEKDQDIAEIDSDKATLSIAAEEDGKIEIMVDEGETIKIGAVICSIDTSFKPAADEKKTKPDIESKKEVIPEKVVQDSKLTEVSPEVADLKTKKEDLETALHISPLAQKLMKENAITDKDLIEFFKSHRISKKDIEYYISEKDGQEMPLQTDRPKTGTRETERKKMTTLRLKLSERLVSVKNETAMLTTFNEVNMTPIMNLRKKYKNAFEEKYGVRLGFMSFFTRAVAEALRMFPQVNSQIDGDEIVNFKYADIGIAVSAPKGLMVPVIRNAETLGFAEIESVIRELSDKARNNKITIQDMQGGTFTITNGGVFGSMLSTPILNPPQSAILGMHNIVERPIAVNGKIEIHPIMYVALSYDHRIIDGSESVTFLLNVKQMLENPVKLMFGGKDPEKVLLGL